MTEVPDAAASEAGVGGGGFRLFLPFLALLIFGILWRLPTLAHIADYDRFSFWHLQYSDVVKFYFTRDLAAHRLPFIRQDVEYPVITGFFMWLAALAPGIGGYFAVSAAALGGCLAACYWLLARLVPARLLARFAIAPAVALYGVLNWDALGLLGMVAALYFLRRDRPGRAGAALAFGASAKLFPAFILPVLLASSARISRERAVSLLAGFIGLTLVLNLPVALISPHGWAYFLTFQAQRAINPDSIWAHIPGVPDSVAGAIFLDGFLLGLGWLTWRVWRGDRADVASFLGLLLFLLLTRDYSPQYDLWLLPFLALLGCPWALWLIFAVADLTYYAAIFWFYAGGPLPFALSDGGGMLQFSVWGREAALLALAIWGLRRLRGAGSSRLVPRLPPLASRIDVRLAIWLLVVLRVALGLAAGLSAHLLPVLAPGGVAFTDLVLPPNGALTQAISSWQRWDALWYQEIAEHGYHAGDGTLAFYPLYPLLSRLVAPFVAGNIPLAALVVASAAFVGAMGLLYRLARFDVGASAACLAVVLTALFPTGFFLLAPYTEGLFLALTLAAFLAARQGKSWVAGLAGLGAGLTRAQGGLLVLPLVFLYLRKQDEEGKRLGWGIVASALPAMGPVLFTLYAAIVVGETRSPFAVLAPWGVRFGLPWATLPASWHYIADRHDIVEAINLASLVAFTLLTIWATRRLPLSYALYLWPSLGLLYTHQAFSPLGSVSRYLLVLFPVFIVMAIWLARRPRLALPWLLVSLGLQVLLLIYWSNWGFVG